MNVLTRSELIDNDMSDAETARQTSIMYLFMNVIKVVIIFNNFI